MTSKYYCMRGMHWEIKQLTRSITKENYKKDYRFSVLVGEP